MARVLAFPLLFLAACAGSPEFLSGAAVADLTPDHPVPLGGYGDRKGRPMTGIHDPVCAKALWMESGEHRVCLVTLDLVGISDEFRQDVRKRLSPEVQCDLILAASHNHSGPGALTRSPIWQLAMGKFDAKLYEWYVATVAELVRTAARAGASSKPTISVGQAPELQRNRRAKYYTGIAPTDPEVIVLRAGHAVLTIYAAHGTVLGAENFLISGDWPGAFQRALERRLPVTALYANGAEGDLSPSAPEGKDDFERCEKLGDSLASKVESFLDGAEPCGTALLYIEEGVDLPKATIPFVLARSVVGLLRVGDLLLACVPGEMSAELGLELKRRLRRPDIRHVGILGLANDHLGYFLTEEQFRKGGYERSVSFYGPGMGAWLLDRFEKLAAKMEEPGRP